MKDETYKLWADGDYCINGEEEPYGKSDDFILVNFNTTYQNVVTYLGSVDMADDFFKELEIPEEDPIDPYMNDEWSNPNI